jgi:hypothetical protein
MCVCPLRLCTYTVTPEKVRPAAAATRRALGSAALTGDRLTVCERPRERVHRCAVPVRGGVW